MTLSPVNLHAVRACGLLPGAVGDHRRHRHHPLSSASAAWADHWSCPAGGAVITTTARLCGDGHRPRPDRPGTGPPEGPEACPAPVPGPWTPAARPGPDVAHRIRRLLAAAANRPDRPGSLPARPDHPGRTERTAGGTGRPPSRVSSAAPARAAHPQKRERPRGAEPPIPGTGPPGPADRAGRPGPRPAPGTGRPARRWCRASRCGRAVLAAAALQEQERSACRVRPVVGLDAPRTEPKASHLTADQVRQLHQFRRVPTVVGSGIIRAALTGPPRRSSPPAVCSASRTASGRPVDRAAHAEGALRGCLPWTPDRRRWRRRTRRWPCPAGVRLPHLPRGSRNRGRRCHRRLLRVSHLSPGRCLPLREEEGNPVAA